MRPRTALPALLLALAAAPAAAHEVRPGYLELREVAAGEYDGVWKVPARGDQRLGIHVALPDGCTVSDRVGRLADAAYLERWRAHCPGGLVGRSIAIEGLAATRTDVLVRLADRSGRVQTVRLTPDAPSLTVTAAAGWTQVARTYFGFGVEHILLGVDHLLFVLALLFLVGSGRRLLGTVTAFTLAHSLTLAAATLGWVHVAQAPVEATIALSIVFVASEILHARAGRPGLALRRPWVVAFSFGLLHGLGFAGALRDVGLPEQAIPAALAFFNLGVEAGQIAFVAAVVVALRAALVLARALPGRPVDAPQLVTLLSRPSAYAIGTVAAYWVIQRTATFFA